MATYPCPKGHSSTENDYCSECGAKIEGAGGGGSSPAAPAIQSPASPSSAVLKCPDCGITHLPTDGDYCEVCGFNFKTGAHGELPVAVQAAPTPAPAPPAAPPPQPPAIEAADPAPAMEAAVDKGPAILGWEVTVQVDPTLKLDDSPAPPTDYTPQVNALRSGSNLIGRNSPRRGIHPEIALDHDDAVSHRHAILEMHGDKSLSLRDIGSSNGTSVNGKEVPQLEDIAIHDGDAITLGHWTRLVIKAVH